MCSVGGCVGVGGCRCWRVCRVLEGVFSILEGVGVGGV